MKNFKKILATVMALATLGCVSAMPTYADYTYGDYYNMSDVQKDENRVDRSAFETVLEENGYTYKDVIFNEAKNTSTVVFANGNTLTLPLNVTELILSSKIENPRKEAVIYTDDEGNTVDTSDNCYYVLGYAISYTHTYKYTGDIEKDYRYDDENREAVYTPLGDSVTLPDGTVLNCEGLRDVQAVYDLNGKYMGFRVSTSSAEEGTFSDIYTVSSDSNVTVGNSNTVGESEPTGVRGDINYDGKVTTLDLLLLKKYLLGIIKW